jgi:type II pantothenate kinase
MLLRYSTRPTALYSVRVAPCAGGWIGQRAASRFETRVMSGAIDMVEHSTLHRNIQTIGCTGGGAYKFASEFRERLGIDVIRSDELDCLVLGLHFALTNIVGECYTYRPEGENDTEACALILHSCTMNNVRHFQAPDSPDARRKRWLKEYTCKVHLPSEFFATHQTFPYLVVSIGSGVSILKVRSVHIQYLLCLMLEKVSGPKEYRRVSGSSVGGGTYWGLCRLLTKYRTYDEVLRKAEHGNSQACDMLVGDIYGRDYDRYVWLVASLVLVLMPTVP